MSYYNENQGEGLLIPSSFHYDGVWDFGNVRYKRLKLEGTSIPLFPGLNGIKKLFLLM